MSLLATVCSTLLAQGSAQQAPDPDEQEPQLYIYYDYVEDGQLRGGRVLIDPTNPLHVDLGPTGRTSGSPVTTLLDNGPSGNRIDIVFVGDGYTAGELDTYAADVDQLWPTFLAEPPLSTYATYFNIHRVDVTSLESGVDNDPTQGIRRDTALDMGYWCSGIQRLLCVDVNKANTQAASARDVDSVLALANSGTYGGAGYANLGTVAGHNFAAIEIALHEFGHSFAGLADEYEYGGPTTYTGPEPVAANVSTLDEAQLLAREKKWYRWLDLPAVGAFEGAMYSLYGLYRPTFNSKMRNLGAPFQEVNAERFVRMIYIIVQPIDSATPAGSYPLDSDFFVDPMDPVGHALDVQWYLDGNAVPGATGTTFDSGTLGLTSGAHDLTVEVVDNTPMVRNPAIRRTKLTDRRSWTLVDGRNVQPHAGASGSPGPLLTVGGSLRPGGTLEFEIDAGRDALPEGPQGMVPLVFVSRAGAAGSRVPRSVALGSSLVTCVAGTRWSAPGRALELAVDLPDDAELSERVFYAQAALYDPAARRGTRLVWTNTLEFVLER